MTHAVTFLGAVGGQVAQQSARSWGLAVPAVGASLRYALSYSMRYSPTVAHTVTFHIDETAESALAQLTADGTPVATAVRKSLVEAAERHADEDLRR